MNLHITLAPLISLIAGVLILLMPRLLNFIVAIYLIAIGLIGVFGLDNFLK
jgi:hypothetical protein